MAKKTHLIFTASVILLTILVSGLSFLSPFISRSSVEKVEASTELPLVQPREGEHVLIHLDTMELELRDGSKVLESLPLLSQGKPGSYFETIGGVYENDYKTPLHFSSIGHVYMPYSVHVFGNYFIHGVPYHANGEKVSSAYSGGCIRLSDTDAKKVYDFVKRGTPIVITRDGEFGFTQTTQTDTTFSSQEMTNLMVATISLEVLTQDDTILDTDRITKTTRKSLLPRLLIEGDTSVSTLYASSRGENTFVNLMNQKAVALGLSNTQFNDVTSPVVTSSEDYARFMEYILTYKSYLKSKPFN